MLAIDSLTSSSTTTSSGAREELGQKDFLRLLVTQLQNQDPVNPVENNEFLSQIAQFSMVNGIEGLGTSFGGMQTNLFANQAMESAQLVGKEVLVNSPGIDYVPGSDVAGVVETESTVFNLNIQVRTESGELVRAINLGQAKPGTHEISWDGFTQEGDEAEAGAYVIEAVAVLDGEPVSLPVQLFQRVSSASIDHASGNVALNLANDDSVSFTQIQKIR